MHSLLGRSDVGAPAITVVGRGVSLEESLRLLVASGDEGLRPFTYSVLRAFGHDPHEVARRLPGIDSRAVRDAHPGTVAHAAAAAIAEALPCEGVGLDLLARHWSEWVDVELTGQIAYERFRPPSGDSWVEAAGHWETPLLHDSRVEDLVGALRREPNRGSALALINEAELTPGDKDELVAWYEMAYADFVARNNRADWIDITGGRFADAPVAPIAGVRAHTVSLRGEGPKHLGEMPQSQYEVLCYRARDALAAWNADPTPAAADRIAYAIERAQAQDDLFSERRELKYGLAATVLVTAALVAVDMFAASLPVGFWLVPLATLALSLLPEISAMRAPFRAVRESSLRSTIHLTSGG